MTYNANLEPPRKGLIRQEIVTIEEENGIIVKRTNVRAYAEDGIDYLDHMQSEPLVYLHGRSTKISGIDFSTEAIDIANSQYTHKNLKFQSMDVNEIKEKFDVIVSNGTLEHMDDPLKSLKLFKKHLTKNGCIITTSPNWSNPRGYMLMPLLLLFNAPITLADLHYFTPVDFKNFSKQLGMSLSWKTFDKSWGHGDILVQDFKKRLPNVLRDSNLPNKKKNIDLLIKWIQNNINKLNHDLPHSGATGLYKLTIKKSQ